MLRKDEKNSDQSLRSIHAESAPKLHSHYGSKNISQPSFIEVLDEVWNEFLINLRVLGVFFRLGQDIIKIYTTCFNYYGSI